MMTVFDAYAMTDIAVMKSIGEKIKSKRISRRHTREQIAQASGVALSSVKNAENGNNISMMTLIQILRALEAFDLLELFWKEDPIDPIALAEISNASAVMMAATALYTL